MHLSKKLSEIQKSLIVNKVVGLVLTIQTGNLTKLYGELSEKEKNHIQRFFVQNVMTGDRAAVIPSISVGSFSLCVKMSQMNGI